MLNFFWSDMRNVDILGHEENFGNATLRRMTERDLRRQQLIMLNDAIGMVSLCGRMLRFDNSFCYRLTSWMYGNCELCRLSSQSGVNVYENTGV